MQTTLTALLVFNSLFFFSQTMTESEAKQFADNIYTKINNGFQSFHTTARLYSEDTSSAKNGGECVIERGINDKEFEEAVFKLKINELSKPFKTNSGYHIVQVLYKDEKKVKIMRILITFKS